MRREIPDEEVNKKGMERKKTKRSAVPTVGYVVFWQYCLFDYFIQQKKTVRNLQEKNVWEHKKILKF